MLMLDSAELISNETELNELLANITDESFPYFISRTDTKWRLHQITNLLFFVNHLKHAPLGAPLQLPNSIKHNRGLINVSVDWNLCFFRCLAIFKGTKKRRCENKAIDLFYQYFKNVDVPTFNGITVDDLIVIEDLFKINVTIYKLNEKSAQLCYRSRGLYDQTMNLNKYQNQLSLICDFDKYCAVYCCMSCKKLYYGRKGFKRHCKTYKVITRQKYPGGIFKAEETIFEKLAMIDVYVPLNDRNFLFYSFSISKLSLINKTSSEMHNNSHMKPDTYR